MKRSLSGFGAGLFAVVVAVLCSCGRPVPPADLVARVGVREVRVEDLEREAARRSASGQPSLGGEALLEELIRREVMIDRALKLGLDRDPVVLRSWENLLIGRLRERELEPRLRAVEASADGVDLPRGTNRVPRARPEQRRFAVLQMKVPSRGSEVARTRAIARLREARDLAARDTAEDAGFGSLAVDYSDDQATRYRGGVVGWFTSDPTKSRLPPEVLAAGFGLRWPGEISDVIPTAKDGFYLVKMLESRHGDPESPDPDRTAAVERQARLRQRRRDIEIAFHEELRRGTRVELFPEPLRQASIEIAAKSTSNSNEPPPLP